QPAPLVVGDDGLGDVEALGDLVLGEALLLAEPGQALAHRFLAAEFADLRQDEPLQGDVDRPEDSSRPSVLWSGHGGSTWANMVIAYSLVVESRPPRGRRKKLPGGPEPMA